MNNEPLRIFEGTARPHEPFWRFRNEAGEVEPQMELYGPISEYSWWGDEVTPQMFKDDLNRNGKGGPITVRINSPGGEVIAASVIKAALTDYPGRVTVMIDGLAASAATIVAMAGDVIKMQESAYFMIHDPSTIAWGTIDELKQVLSMLKTIKEGIVDAYETRTGLDAERLAKMMTEETWLTAREAKEMGFVDEVIGTNPKKAGMKAAPAAYLNALRNYVNLPETLRAQLQPEAEAVVQTQQAQNAEETRLRAEVQLYV